MNEGQEHLTNAQFQVSQKAIQEFPFPSDRNETIIEVYYMKGDHLFICGIIGKANTDTILEMEKQMAEDTDIFDKGSGRYLYNAWIEEEEKDHYGCVVFPGYWWFEPVAFKSLDSEFQIPTTPEEVAEFEKTFTPPVITDDQRKRAFQQIEDILNEEES